MRIDKYFSDKYGSRTKAARATERGEIIVNGRRVSPSYEVKESDRFTFSITEKQFVSAGGAKLEKALNDFSVDVNGKIFADIGASTGGFTDCLLRRGADKVYCIDVGESQLDKSLLDKNVVVIDNFNARNLSKQLFREPIEGVVADVSFISLTYILDGIAEILTDDGLAVLLIKPQFELERRDIGKNGIVKDCRARAAAIRRVYDFAVECGLSPLSLTSAPEVKGKNAEYPVLLAKNRTAVPWDKLIKCVKL